MTFRDVSIGVMSEVIAFRPRGSAAAHAPPQFEAEGVDGLWNIWDVCPWGETLTAYDKRNLGLFARLLHDEAEGASEADIARDVFGMGARLNSRRARLMVRSHMCRAHWLENNVFPLLGW
jgi:hypothetical protein